ncbi:MAG: cytochrome c3 family protein [Thermodesulfobacteriota bacterium]
MRSPDGSKEGQGMKIRLKWVFLFSVAIPLFVLSVAYSQDPFRLKPGAKGKLCLNCHEPFQDKLKSPFVHTPVKEGECSECHNPHTSSHGKLLSEDPQKVCIKCHEGLLPEKPKSAHSIVIQGNCVKCHDPHASNHKGNLLKAGNELCFGCHKNIGDAVAKVKFKHAPVEKGCLNCHDPHASAKAVALLKNDLVPLCLECHKPDRPAFAKQHVNYPVVKADCSSCHDPHGSDNAGILFTYVHEPVANRMCSQCHEAATSPDPFKTRRGGFELCRGCHSNMMNETLNQNRVHWPLMDKTGCMNCHEPHASKGKKLVKGDMVSLCGRCHSDTVENMRKLAAKDKEEKAAAKGRQPKGELVHQPVQEGECLTCHSVHGSNQVLLMKQRSMIELCGNCHDWLKHTSHPMGEKVIDSRNKNLTMDCLSCHRSHGTGYRYMVPFSTPTELCVQCHKQLKR